MVHGDRDETVLLGKFLAQNGFAVEHAHELRRALDCLDGDGFDAVLIDAQTLAHDTVRVLRRVRERRTTAAIVIAVDPGSLGREFAPMVDEWLRPPWVLADALARVQLALSRRTLVVATQHVVAGDLMLDVGDRVARYAGHTLALTALEFDLLVALARSIGSAVPRASLRLIANRRGPAGSDRALDVHVCHLRAKLREAGSGPHAIRTVRGVGYLLSHPARARDRGRG